MPKETWMIAGGLTIALLLGLLGFSSWDKKQRIREGIKAVEAAQTASVQAQAEAHALKQKLAEAQAALQQLQKEKESAIQAVQTHRTLEDEMRAALESKDVTISKLQGKLTVNILDRVMFDSGEADVKPGGEAVLRKVAKLLEQHPGIKIHVIGHTDNVPIKASARNRFPSNWELSTARATAAVRFLTETAGVDPRRVGAVGYGEFRPVADNSTTEGRAQNRRIAITILSEELVGSDAVAVPGMTNRVAAPDVPPGNPEAAEPARQ